MGDTCCPSCGAWFVTPSASNEGMEEQPRIRACSKCSTENLTNRSICWNCGEPLGSKPEPRAAEVVAVKKRASASSKTGETSAGSVHSPTADPPAPTKDTNGRSTNSDLSSYQKEKNARGYGCGLALFVLVCLLPPVGIPASAVFLFFG